jgi:NAD(P)-dependent dehydrogenase (short-subunit alcohol dehydrogenase family)
VADNVYEGRRLLVVGASSGIGWETARAATQQGAKVAVSARRSERLDEFTEEFGGTAVTGDVTDEAHAKAIISAASAAMGGLDAVLYCAGRGTLAPLEETQAADWAADYAVNVIGANLICAAALPRLDLDGLIGFVSSRGPLDLHWGLASYTSSKAALDNSIDAWRVEHPERRFLRIVMGNTMPTEFADEYDPALIAAATDRWITQGIDLNVMQVTQLGEQLARSIALVLREPGVDVPEIRFDARGVPLG